jgi:GNAT superfamily N-acetyltransferase
MEPITIGILENITTIEELAADAQADSRRMVSRLIQEWNDGSNRFDEPGERLYYSARGTQICAVCGLNRDPFADHPAVGRVRRLYVAVAARRMGVGSAIMNRLMVDAKKHFSTLHLRTFDPGACGFYEAMGFSKVVGDANCTHRLNLVL